MKRILPLLSILLIALPLSAVLRFPAPQTFRLDNGLTIYVVSDNDLPLVSMRMLTAGAGSAYETTEGAGRSDAPPCC